MNALEVGKIVAAVLITSASVSGQANDRELVGGPVATVGGKQVSLGDLASKAEGRLLRANTEAYETFRSVLEEYVDDMILNLEAGHRSITVQALLKTEVMDRIEPATETEAKALAEGAPSIYGRMRSDRGIRTALMSIRQQRLAKRRTQFLAGLRAKYGYSVLVDPPRLTAAFDGGHTKGPVGAPVTIVAFSDFQCPFCASSALALQEIAGDYPEDVRLVFKHFPSPAHAQAIAAAESSVCAAEQDKFWAFHDVAFSEPELVNAGDFQSIARRAGLSLDRFESCRVSKKVAETWHHDLDDGREAGVSGTPTLFINGRMVVGARSTNVLREIINEEIVRTEKY